ncbi:hypothetical protein ATCVCanal1_002L [Acanthocystis turfacea Chlorella virus Canal-1]|nr:hypothetical protein ATCVCanal1_002L [Acanthocystis turfacea Chlorella virus Canal-1]
MIDIEDIGNRNCVSCGAPFTCGISAGGTTCWCMEFPNKLPVDKKKSGCYCPKCLKKVLEEHR